MGYVNAQNTTKIPQTRLSGVWWVKIGPCGDSRGHNYGTCRAGGEQNLVNDGVISKTDRAALRPGRWIESFHSAAETSLPR